MELLTPDGVAGVAVVRVAPGERDAVLRMLRMSGGLACAMPTGVPLRATLHFDARDVDDVVVVDRGRGGFELHLHGSPAVIDALEGRFGVQSSSRPGAAASLLRRALGDAQLDLALEQLEFDFDREVAQLQALPTAARVFARAQALARSRVALALVATPRVVLFGPQNAGKSSLFNRLLCRERALTGPEAGLTRDPVAEVVVLAGYPYELVDTAGEGRMADAVDEAALALGRQARDGAFRILVLDGSREPEAAELALLPCADLVIASKSDRPRKEWPAGVPRHLEASVVDDLAGIRQRLGELLRATRGMPVAGPVGGFAALDRDQMARLLAISG